MNDFALRKTSSSGELSSSNVIPFHKRKQSTESWEEYDIPDGIIGNPAFERYLKDIVEGIIYSNFTVEQSASLISDENPFDSIYLAELTPDPINKENVIKIKNIAKRIVDKSDLIVFDDGWDE